MVWAKFYSDDNVSVLIGDGIRTSEALSSTMESSYDSGLSGIVLG